MKLGFACVSFTLSLVLATTSAMAVTTIQTSAYALFSDIKAASIVGVAIGPIAATSGLGAPAYNANNSVASLNANVALGVVGVTTTGLHIGTGLLQSTSSANSTPAGNTTYGSASSQVDNLGVDLFTKVLTAVSLTTLGLTADTVSSTTTVQRIGASTVFTGTSQFEDLSVKLLSLVNFGLGANASVVPNTVLINNLGIKITLNEQIAGGNGVTMQSLTTNAISIVLTDYLIGGRLLSGHLIIGNSKAQINYDDINNPPETGVVPEPAIWLELIAGFGLTGGIMRRRAVRTAS